MKWLLALFLAILPSCALIPHPATVPVRTLETGQRAGKELVVFLPGRWSRIEEFEREGFFQIARKRWPGARLIAPDLHLAYYKNRSMARRLHEDVIVPARRDGVKKIRLVGISLGGFGALAYAVEHPNEVDQIILLSPYLGENDALNEIRVAGGVKYWRPGPGAEADFGRELWLELGKSHNLPPILLGCGTEDRLAPASYLFAANFLKPADQEWVPGAHDWKTWRVLFERLAAR